MKIIDIDYDNILNVEYELHKGNLSELKTIATEWYKDIDLTKFDNRFLCESDEDNFINMKKSGLVSNLFFAYKEGDKTYLLDGYNRLFTNYGKIETDTPVYLKLITTKLEDHKLIGIMYQLNLWKLANQDRINGGFDIKNFLDRGFRLLLFSKFDIELYHHPNNIRYADRERSNYDIDALDHYFINEQDFAGYFKTSYYGVEVLLTQKNIINDFKAILKANNYNNHKEENKDKYFKNYEKFVEGYIMYLHHLRIKGYSEPIELDYFLKRYHEDKVFSKKLPTMSGNDVTRKNIYKFYRNFNKDLLKSN